MLCCESEPWTSPDNDSVRELRRRRLEHTNREFSEQDAHFHGTCGLIFLSVNSGCRGQSTRSSNSFPGRRICRSITPPWLDFRMVKTPQTLAAGSLIRYRLRWRWLPIRWTTEISEWDPPHRFVDREVSGPYALWNHEHRFTSQEAAQPCVTVSLMRCLLGGLDRLRTQRWSGEMWTGFSTFARKPCGVYFPPEGGCTNIPASYTNSESVEWRVFLGGPRPLYLKPKNLSEAVSLLATSGGQILAGGTDFYPALGDRLPQGNVVDIAALGEIRGISADENHIRIGGLTTWTEVIRAPLPRCFDALKAAAREVGSVQIQNRGTVAGNLCNASPAADGVPPLLALDAEVELASSVGYAPTDFSPVHHGQSQDSAAGEMRFWRQCWCRGEWKMPRPFS